MTAKTAAKGNQGSKAPRREGKGRTCAATPSNVSRDPQPSQHSTFCIKAASLLALTLHSSILSRAWTCMGVLGVLGGGDGG